MTDDIARLKAEMASIRKQASVEAEAERREEAKFTALLDSQKARSATSWRP